MTATSKLKLNYYSMIKHNLTKISFVMKKISYYIYFFKCEYDPEICSRLRKVLLMKLHLFFYHFQLFNTKNPNIVSLRVFCNEPETKRSLQLIGKLLFL